MFYLIVSAVAVQAAESSAPPLPDFSGLTGQERSMCQVHGIAHTNCVAKKVSSVDEFATCMKEEIGEILQKKRDQMKAQ